MTRRARVSHEHQCEFVTGRFAEPADARDAMVEIERFGVDAGDIHLHHSVDVATPDAQDDVDRAVTGRIGRNYARGALIGASAGAVLACAVLLVVGVRPVGLALLTGCIAGGIAGVLLGGFYTVAARLPVNEDVYETLLTDRRGDDVLVEVRVQDPDTGVPVAEVMRRHHAAEVSRHAA